ncbi:MAG: 23S rRNA (uracil(1939)-C(5))-methyltransferase RlmD [Lachnospiraceae bacterium]|nr:23S rRNA (uracil(1939)-C(5))-methyltransferase RlmD [Lachnospiraceae bacterium]
MKKGDKAEGIVLRTDFPNKGIVVVETENGMEEVMVKNALPGQKISCIINKKKHGKMEGRLAEVLEASAVETDSDCPHFGTCGGCLYRTYPYKEQVKIKGNQVERLLQPVYEKFTGEERKPWKEIFEGVKESPVEEGYRNKMEFTFGDEYKDGPLSVGMHKRGSFYDIVSVEDCRIVDEDYRKILRFTREYFTKENLPFFHRLSHEGYLRHLLVRKAVKTGEILVALVTTTGLNPDLKPFTEGLLSLELTGKLAGIIHIFNDSVADVVKNEGMEILYGKEDITEELLGLSFRITPFSFFQTNSLGAEVLYETVREFLGEMDKKDPVVYDLYSGTGTIAQLLAPVSGKVVGVEIVEEAVEAAKENAAKNGLTNCEFLAGDVLKVLDDIEVLPDYIILDPPRDGIHPKALQQIISYGVDKMVYVSCKPTSLARDLEAFLQNGYNLQRACCVDMFPATANVETVALLSK